MNNKFKVLDLFCGCGGMTEGLIEAGLEPIAGIDIWDKAIASYESNFDHIGICEDLRKLPPEKFNEKYNKEGQTIDIIVGVLLVKDFQLLGNVIKKIREIHCLLNLLNI